MFRFVVLASVLALSVNGQYHSDPRTAAIISEQRYLTGDGKFGAAYTQEDGTDFKEETDSDGTRHGSYSYIDPNGQKRSISYVAGKQGFQASGDHLPVAPPAPAHAQLAAANAQNYKYSPEPGAIGGGDGFDDGQYDPRYNDPNFEGNSRDQSSYAQANFNAQSNYDAQPSYAQQQAPQAYAAQPQAAAPQPQQPNPNYNNYNNINYVAQYQPTTASPRVHHPGKLQLSRTPDGFSYSFNKV